MNKKIYNKLNISMSVFLLIGIVILINFFAYNIFVRWDLTENKDYSISSATKNAISDLDDLVNIKIYFSSELPSQYSGLRQSVGDILDSYEKYSNSKIKYEFIDPTDNDKLTKELQYKGIPELQFEIHEKDKLQIVRGFLGLEVQYADKSEVIPVVESTTNLEYQVTLAIKKSIADSMSVVGILSSNGSVDGDTAKFIKEKLSELYVVRDVNLEKDAEIDSGINNLIIISPTEEFSQEELEKIDNYFMSGNPLLVLYDGIKVEEGLQASVNKTGLEKLLSDYGITVAEDLVLESPASSGQAAFTQGFFTFRQNYPMWPIVKKDGFNKDNDSVSRLESVLFPWASSLSFDSSKVSEGADVSYLARTSDKSWSQKGSFDLNPQQKFKASGDKGPKVLAYDVSAVFKSPYQENKESVNRLIVVGDSNFLTTHGNSGGDNLVFFQNIVDSLNIDSDLINIRSKGISSRPVKDLSDTAHALVRYANIFGLTIVVMLFGLFRYFSRRRSKMVDEV